MRLQLRRQVRDLLRVDRRHVNARLRSLAREDMRFCPIADKYWNARGGSSSDGGAFIFTVDSDQDGRKTLSCTNKFGHEVKLDGGSVRCDVPEEATAKKDAPDALRELVNQRHAEGVKC